MADTQTCQRSILDLAADIFGGKSPVSQEKLTSFVRDMQKMAARFIGDDPSLSQAEALEMAGDEFIRRTEAAAELAHKRVILNSIAKANFREELKTHNFDPKHFKKMIDGFGKEQGAMMKIMMSGKDGFESLIDKADLWGVYHDPENEIDIARAIAGEEVENDQVRQLGKIIADSQEKSRLLQNRWGADIKKLEGFVAHTTHDPMKMLKVDKNYIADKVEKLKRALKPEERREAAFQRWKSTIEPLLDMNEVMELAGIGDTEKEVDAFFRGAYKGSIKTVHNRADIAQDNEERFQQPKPVSGAAFANRISPHRILIFKDAESWVKYNQDYGTGNINQSIAQTFERAAKNVIILKRLGPDADRNYTEMERVVGGKAENIKTKAILKQSRNTWGQVNGTANSPVSYKLARISSNIRSFTDLTKLGSVVFTSLNDLASAAANLNFNGIDITTRWGTIFDNLMNFFNKKGDRLEVAQLLGTWSENMVGSYNRFGVNGDASGLITKINHTFFKLTGLVNWDFTHRTGTVSILSRDLARQKNLKFSQLHENRQNALKNFYNIGEKEWDLMRKHAQKVGSKQEEYITPDGVREASKEDVAEYLGKPASRLSPTKIQDTIDEQELRWMTYFHDSANHSILEPDAALKGFVTQGLESGTPAGEVMKFVAQYKTYPIAFIQRTLGRSIGRLPTTTAKIQASAEMIAATVVLTYIGDRAKDVIQNRTAPDISKLSPARKFQFFLRLAAPGAGLWGDFLTNAAEGQGIIRPLLGPTASNIDKIASIAGQVARGNNPANAATSFVKGNIPFSNLWFTHGAFNYLVMKSIEDRIDPGAAMRARNRLLQNGQDYIINPG